MEQFELALPSRDAQQVSLVVGKSTVVDVPVPIKRASLADPQIADAIVLSPKQIYVTGRDMAQRISLCGGKMIR